MIEDLRKWVQGQLRMGVTIQDVVDAMFIVTQEVKQAEKYVQAIKESDFRP
jgi:hypothetical protein